MSTLLALTPDDAANLSDSQFQAAFEAVEMDVKAFDHEQHVRLAWLYLKEHDLEQAFQRYKRSLIKFATAWGYPGLYHETITWCYLSLIHQAVATSDNEQTWVAFRDQNPAIMSKSPPIIFHHYSKDLIASKEARASIVEPDIKPLQG